MNIHQKDFPSTAQKSIWHTSVFMSPFYEIVPPDTKKEMMSCFAAGEKDFYNFMTALYLDMYNNPGNYFISTTEYDIYMKGRKREDLPHKNDPRECTLRNKFQKSIRFYQDFLYETGKSGKLDPDTLHLAVPEPVLQEILHKLKVYKREEHAFDRIHALKSVGFTYQQADKTFVFFNRQYPLMCPGLSALSKSKNKSYGYTCFLLCDFRGLSDSFEITFKDTLSILKGESRQIASEVNDVMNQNDTRLTIMPLRNTLLHSFWKLKYSRKGKAACSMHIDINSLDVFLNFNSVKNISSMGYILNEKSGELFNWFYDHIKTMNCSCKNNRKADIGGRKKRICGLMNRMEIRAPGMNDLEKMKKILELFY